MSAQEQTDVLKTLALAKKKQHRQELLLAFNPNDVSSRPTPDQDRAFREMATFNVQDVRGGNQSGKSQYGAKNVSWFCGRNHPYIDIEKKWPNQPMLVLVLARTSTHYEEHWEKRISPYFEPSSYKVSKVGGVLKTIRFKNGSKIIFFSYENPYEAAERVQSFTGHLIWIDEICGYRPLYEESERRLQVNDGRLLITYTAKKPVPEVRKYIEARSPYKQSYAFDAYDNPVYSAEAKKKIEASLNQMPPEEREKWYNTVRFGAWMEEEGSVYNYDAVLHGKDLPDNYDRLAWRHHEIIDPAASGKCGFLLATEHPLTGMWYLIKAKYLAGEAPSDLLAKVEEETKNYRVTHRTCDPNAAWFIKEAALRKRHYGGVLKDGRKTELIKGVSTALRENKVKLVEDLCEFLIDEMGTAKWSAKDTGKIANSTKFHLLDCFQYFIDTRPKFALPTAAPNILVLLDLANQKRKRAEASRIKKKKNNKLRYAFRVRR